MQMRARVHDAKMKGPHLAAFGGPAGASALGLDGEARCTVLGDSLSLGLSGAAPPSLSAETLLSRVPLPTTDPSVARIALSTGLNCPYIEAWYDSSVQCMCHLV